MGRTAKKREKADDPPKLPSSQAEAAALVKLANSGDTAALQTVKAILSGPDALEACRMFHGDLYSQTVANLVENCTFATNGQTIRAAIYARCRLLRLELEGQNPSPIEALLAQRIVVCWLQTHLAEIDFAARQAGNGQSAAGANFRQRLIDRAHGRLLGSIRSLALVRKVALPTILTQVVNVRADLDPHGPPALPEPIEGPGGKPNPG